MSTRNPSDARPRRLMLIIIVQSAALIALPTIRIMAEEPVEIGTAVSIERPTCEEA
jgi:hypothetical protein